MSFFQYVGISSVINKRTDIIVFDTRRNMKIATWNVRTMYQAGKLKNITNEATRLKVDILGLAEGRWLDLRNFQCASHTLIFTGATGVELLLSKTVSHSVM